MFIDKNPMMQTKIEMFHELLDKDNRIIPNKRMEMMM